MIYIFMYVNLFFAIQYYYTYIPVYAFGSCEPTPRKYLPFYWVISRFVWKLMKYIMWPRLHILYWIFADFHFTAPGSTSHQIPSLMLSFGWFWSVPIEFYDIQIQWDAGINTYFHPVHFKVHNSPEVRLFSAGSLFITRTNVVGSYLATSRNRN